MLRERGHKITVVSTAEKCLKIYSRGLQRAKMRTKVARDVQPYYVVMLDYKMPDRNGIEVAKEILALNLIKE